MLGHANYSRGQTLGATCGQSLVPTTGVVVLDDPTLSFTFKSCDELLLQMSFFDQSEQPNVAR